jgi:hypothetical protein
MVKKCILCENERFLIKSYSKTLKGLIEEYQKYSFFCYDCLNKPHPIKKNFKYSFCPTCEGVNNCDPNYKLLQSLISEGDSNWKITYYKG